MSKLMQDIRAGAKAAQRTVVLPEGEEARTLAAAAAILREGIAKLILIGDPAAMKRVAPAADISKATVVNPKTADLKKYAALLYQLRKAKGLSEEDAEKLAKNPLYLGVLLVQAGEADGMVSGAIHSTGDTLKPALQVIKTAPGISTVSSCFIMVKEGSGLGKDGVLVFGDCAVNINPDANALAAIAIASAESAKTLAGIDVPAVAMLSFSTKGSAKHELVDKVTEATRLVKELQPTLLVDGELQADAALVESVAGLKAPGSPVAGRANVLIFPDLQAGNIGYKLVQRFSGAEAIGPICQGFNKPVNDLSRGCSPEDIIDVVAITALQAK